MKGLVEVEVVEVEEVVEVVEMALISLLIHVIIQEIVEIEEIVHINIIPIPKIEIMIKHRINHHQLPLKILLLTQKKIGIRQVVL
jgi:hypothetical protein